MSKREWKRPPRRDPNERLRREFGTTPLEPKVPRNILLRPLDLPPMVPIKDQPDTGIDRLLDAVRSGDFSRVDMGVDFSEPDE